jgi:hypothetical protein
LPGLQVDLSEVIDEHDVASSVVDLAVREITAIRRYRRAKPNVAADSEHRAKLFARKVAITESPRSVLRKEVDAVAHYRPGHDVEEVRLAPIALQVLMLGVVMPQLAGASTRADRLATQHFFCHTRYQLDDCLAQIEVLKGVVARFPTEALGQWTWVLVRSQDWKPLVKMLGLDTDSPAFTCLETRTTFIEEALVAKVSGRGSELVARWHMGMTELLNTAVEHEMGHAICQSISESKAKYVAEILEKEGALRCRTGS